MNIWGAFVGILEQALLTLNRLTGNAGLAIIAFTIVARVIILPLTISSLRSTRRMQELQPQLKELQRKYGKDPQKLNEEMVKLYKEYKVNPTGGCLPMLFQFPIFIGVYQAVINLTGVSVAEHAVRPMIDVLANAGLNVAGLAQNIGQARLTGGFLWLTDLGDIDRLYILPVLSVVFQLIVQLMATPRVQDPQQKAMSQSMLIMPLIFGYIGFTFPSGAVLYWVVGSILSMIQQYFISGWGSLANYLKFLPADGGLLPPPQPAVAGATAGGATVEAGGEEPQKLSFWDVLRPLTEQDQEIDIPNTSDPATERAIEQTRRQSGQLSSRRRKARR